MAIHQLAHLITFKTLQGVAVSGIALGLEVAGHGLVSWNFCTVSGEVVSLNIDKVLRIPSLPTRLFSPQQICQQYGGSVDFIVNTSSAKLQINDQVINVPCDSSLNLTIACIELNINNSIKAFDLNHQKNNEELDNLSKAQRQSLR